MKGYKLVDTPEWESSCKMCDLHGTYKCASPEAASCLNTDFPQHWVKDESNIEIIELKDENQDH